MESNDIESIDFETKINHMICNFGLALISSTPEEVCRLAAKIGIPDIDTITAMRMINNMRFNFGLIRSNKYLEYASHFELE